MPERGFYWTTTHWSITWGNQNQLRCVTSFGPIGAGSRIQTYDIFITSEALYQLSYTGNMVGPVGIEPTLPIGNRILSPARLPIPPWSLKTFTRLLAVHR